MKTIFQWFKANHGITLFTILFMLTSYTNLVFSQENSTAVLDPAMNPSHAKENLQTNYAIQIAQLTVNAIHAFKTKYQKTPEERYVNWFTKELLRDDEDKLIKEIKYIKDKSLTVIMQNNKFVAPLLSGKELKLVYVWDKWKIKREFPTLDSTSPDYLMRDIAMILITDYCGGETEDFGFDNMWMDTEWCSYWHQFVMAPL